MRKTMTKCVRKPMVVMMELLILILFYVQANDLALTPSLPLYLPCGFLIPLNLIRPQEQLMQKCLINRVGGCRNFKRIWLFRDIKYEICVVDFLRECFLHMKVSEDRITQRRIENCVQTNGYSRLRMIRTFMQEPVLWVVYWNVVKSIWRGTKMLLIYTQHP